MVVQEIDSSCSFDTTRKHDSVFINICNITLIFLPLLIQTEMYTRVLMGAIDLASAKLPKNTNDGAVDLLTRHYLYAKGLDYRHGTGHGIGSYLKVM